MYLCSIWSFLKMYQNEAYSKYNWERKSWSKVGTLSPSWQRGGVGHMLNPERFHMWNLWITSDSAKLLPDRCSR